MSHNEIAARIVLVRRFMISWSRLSAEDRPASLEEYLSTQVCLTAVTKWGESVRGGDPVIRTAGGLDPLCNLLIKYVWF